MPLVPCGGSPYNLGMRVKKLLSSAACFAFFVVAFNPTLSAQLGYTRFQNADFLTYEELKTLSTNPHPGGQLENKMSKFL